jgi:FAD/FMN-containing dehydrogenase
MGDPIIETLAAIVGAPNVQRGADSRDRSAVWGTNQPCAAKAVVCPADTGQVAAIMQACHAAGQTVVPYGGMTNLVQGAATTVDDIALSFERMDRIEAVDATALTMTVQAGVTMQAAQERADEEGLYFPVDIGARANCMLGGNVATNAGGTRVIRYGMIRDSVLGLEAVLADGTVVSSMNTMLKNNSGFDLKQLFIGTEGVLGLITRIVFRLQARPRSHNVALVACNEFEDVVALLSAARELLAGALCGFEVMWDDYYHGVVQPVGRLPSPIETAYRFYVIIEATGAQPETDNAGFEAALAAMFESGAAADGVIAKSDAEREAIWAIRHEVEWVVRDAHVFDVSLPIADVSAYTEKVAADIKADVAGARVVCFGHLGDNNIHISVLCDDEDDATGSAIESHIYEALRPYGGAISAEHGIGIGKKRWLPISRSEPEIELMNTLKRSLDPKNILNPGKVVSVSQARHGSGDI